MNKIFLFLFVLLSSCSIFRGHIKYPMDTIVCDSLSSEKVDTLCYNIDEVGMSSTESPIITLTSTSDNSIQRERGESVKGVKKVIVRNQKNGEFLYFIPDTMRVGFKYKIVVRISNGSQSDISEGYSQSHVESIRTSSKMEVEVIDPNKSFNIVKNNSDIQIVDSIEYTEWVFNISPINYGKQSLNIVASIVNDDGKKEKVYTKDIVVISNPKIVIHDWWVDFWKSIDWKWTFSTILIPIVIFYYKNRKKRR